MADATIVPKRESATAVAADDAAAAAPSGVPGNGEAGDRLEVTAEAAVLLKEAGALAEAKAAERKAAEDDLEAMPLPSDPRTFFLGGLFLIAVLTVCFFASEVVLPIVLALVLKLLLQPGVTLMERLRIPRMVAVLLLLLVVFGGIVAFGAALSGPAAAWAAKLPEGLPRLKDHLSFLGQPLFAMQHFLQQAAIFAPGSVGAAGVATDANSVITKFLLNGVRTVANGFFTTVILLFFFLMSGDTFLRRMVEILPSFKEKRQAIEIVNQIESDISSYLVTITIMNALVGVATAGAMWASGLGNPVLWGAFAFLVNYVPILGPIAGVGIFLLAGMLTFEPLWQSCLPALLYLAIHVIEGETITPMLVARRFTLNTVLVIIALIFWDWMWGIPGAILAVPMLAITKIVCDRVRPLAAFGHFLEA